MRRLVWLLGWATACGQAQAPTGADAVADVAVVAGAESTESVTVTLRMDPRMLSRIKRLARSRYLNYQSMVKQWLSERMEQELRDKALK